MSWPAVHDRGVWVLLLALLGLIACTKGAPSTGMTRQDVPLVRTEMQGGPDYTRVTFVWMGEINPRHELIEIEGKPAVVVDVPSATLPETLPEPYQREGRSRIWRQEVGEGAITSIQVEPGESEGWVRLTLAGPELERYRVEMFERPDRMVVDLFADSDPGLGAGEADALGSLMEAMTDVEHDGHVPGPFLVVVDAGHGGFEPGATGARGVREKDVNLAIARYVAGRLSQIPNVRAVLTRDSDIFLPLKERTDFANELDADLFVSIHANASPSRAYHGIETYYLNTATDEAAARLARRENTVAGGLAEEASDDHLIGLLRDLSVDGQVEHSRALALNVQQEIVGGLRAIYGEDTVRDLGVKTALFYVLVGTRMPSILVETAFVSNPLEEIRLSDPFYQEEVAGAVVRGVVSYAREVGRL